MTNNSQPCPWCLGNKLYEQYHHQEWGVPVTDDNILFEFLILESFQAGLSWLTILNKRNNFRKAFKEFNPKKISQFTAADENRLMADAGIIRHKLKIKAAINNANCFIKIQQIHGSFARYIWQFVGHKPIMNSIDKMDNIPVVTPIAINISKELKKHGFKFLGPTTVYAYMQAIGLVNDHLTSCPCYQDIIKLTANKKYGV